MNDKILLLINGWAGKNALLDAAMVFAAKYLVFVVFAIALGCMIYLILQKKWRPVMYFFATLVMSFIVLYFMGLLTIDHRPFMDHQLTQLIAHAPGKSFPSDHTTVATAIALGILVFTPFKKLGWMLVVFAALIGFARIFVGVHYPYDIIGGLLTGGIGAGIVWSALRMSRV